MARAQVDSMVFFRILERGERVELSFLWLSFQVIRENHSSVESIGTPKNLSAPHRTKNLFKANQVVAEFPNAAEGKTITRYEVKANNIT